MSESLLWHLLFCSSVSVNDLGKKEAGTTPNGMEDNDAETIANVPVELIYDSENLVVSGAPQTVEVKIEGQRRFVEATKRQRDFTVYIDLSDVEIGKHRVPISYKDFSDKLKVTIEPGYCRNITTGKGNRRISRLKPNSTAVSWLRDLRQKNRK